ncbi:MAG: HAD-IA family hydrolase, partial [Pseudomonadota bacterium]
AKKMRRDYYLEYGTTLAGLMTRHDMEPDPFLDFVHDIDHSVLDPHPQLGTAIRALPGRKFVFTNGSVSHAAGVLKRLDIPLEIFDGVHDIKACQYIPKPERAAFASFIERFAIQPERAAMFEDLPHNLVTAHELGMATVLVSSDYDDHPSQAQVRVHDAAPDHIQHVTNDIERFVRELVS